MNTEIEKKYLIKYIPKEFKINKIVQIEQNFIYDDKFTLIRLRKVKNIFKENNEEYIYTVKTQGNIEYNEENETAKRYEIERNITKEQYEQLIENKINNTIRKTRINIPIKDKLEAEIDIYYEYLNDFLTLEVEFENENQAKQFIKPDWFGEEIGHNELSNRKLSKMTKEEFEKKVTKEQLIQNKKNIDELEIKIKESLNLKI